MRHAARSPSLALSMLAGLSVLTACEDEIVNRQIGKLEMKCCSDITDEAQRVSDKVDFGSVQVGLLTSRTLVVKNAGTGLLKIQKLEVDEFFSTGSWEFKISDSSFDLQPSQSKEVVVSFQSFDDMTEPATSAVKVFTDAIDEMGNVVPPATLTLSGLGVKSGLEVTPNPVEFGNVLIGSSR